MQDLSEGIQVAGSVFAQSGLEISDYSAIIGTAVANTQLSGNEMARAWRNILMNIQGIKGVTSDGDIIDEASFKKAGEAIESLGVKMTYMEGNVQKLRPVMDILNDVAIAWKKLDEAGRNLKIAELQEALGGKLQANALTAVLSNWEQVTKMQQEYFNSAGSAMKENEVYLNSWEAKTEQLKNSWVEFVAKTIDSDWIKGLLDSGTSLLHLFDNLGNTLIILGGAFLALKRDSITDLFISTTNSLQRLYYQVTGNTAALEAMVLAQNASNASANMGKVVYTGMGLALNSALGVVGLVATAIGLLSMGISSYNNHQEEMRRLAVEAGHALKIELDSLEAQKQKVIQLNSELQNSNLSQEDSYKIRKELMGIQAEIIDKYGTEASSINFVTASVDELTKSYDKLSEAEARKYQQEYQSAFGDAKQYLDKERNNLLYIRSFSNDEVYEHLKNEVEKLDGKLEEMFDSSLGSTHELAIGFQIEFDKSTVEEQIVLYRNLFDAIKAQSVGASEEVSSRLDKIASDISDKINELDNETYKQHKEIFEKYIVSEVFSVDEYKNYYRDILNLQEEYYEAVSNNDEESANAKLKQMNTLKESYAESLNDTNIVNYLDSMFSSLNTQLSQNKFKLEFEADDSSLKASIEDILNDLKDLDDISILNLANVEGTEKQQAAYKRLIEIQDIYGLKIETLIELLVKLNLIQGKPLPTNPLKNNIDTAEEAKKKYKELGDTLVDTIEQIKSLNSIQEKASKEGIFDFDSLKTIISLYPEAIQYADDYGKMQQFIADKTQEATRVAIASFGKISFASQESVSNIIEAYDFLPSALASYYGADYDNFVTNAKGKYEVEAKVVDDLADLWRRYSGMSAKTVRNMISGLSAAMEGGQFSDAINTTLKEYQLYEKLFLANEKEFESFKPILSSGGSQSKGSGSKSKKESKTIELDTLLLLEKEYSEIERQLSFIKKQKEDISLSSEQQVALAEKEITLLKHQQELRHQMAQQIRSEMKSKINVLDKYGIEVEFIPEINKLDFKQSIEEIEGIINSINLGDSDKTSDMRATLKDYINDINSSNDDLKNHSSTWYELQQLIYAANLEVASGEYYKYINNCSKSLENLDYQLELVDSNNTDEKLELINKQIQIQETVLEKNNEQLKNLQLLYKDGKINAEQFKTETDNVTKSMQESTLQLKKYNDEIKNLKLSSLEQQKNAISSIVELTKKLIQQEAKDEIDALKEITKEDNEQKKILKEINDELKKRFDKEKEIANEKKKAIDNELKAYKKKIELQKNSLDLDKEQRYYEQNLSEKQLDIRTIKDRLVELQGNDSLSANAERNRLQEELAKKQLDLDNFIFDNNIDRQKDALDSELERYQTAAEKEKELIDKNLKAYEDSINKRIALNDKESEQLDLMAEKRNQQIEEIQKRIENNGTLTLEAMKRIDGEGDVLRDKLIEWNKVYGTGIEEDITGAWQDFNQVVITGNGILDTTRSLMQEISALSKEIANYQSNFGSVGIRDHFESLGYDVGWNDSSKRFSIDGKEFDAKGYDNIDGHLQTTLDGIRDLEKQIQNSLKGIPGLSTGGILETDRVIQAHSGERVLRKIETTDLHSILPQMLNNQQAFSVVQEQLLNQFSQKNLPIDNSFDSLPNINIENHVTLEGVATNELLRGFEEKLIESNDVITTKINNAIRKNGGNTHKKPY